MKITYYGHSCLGIEINDIHIIVDPFISGNPKAASIDVDSLKADYIMLTHAHYDHVLDVERIIKRTNATIISNHEIVTYYGNKDFKGHGMNHGGSWEFDFGTVKAVSAIHSSSFSDGTYGGNPLGFIIQANGKTVYLAGDTALTMDMKLIPMFHKLDLAILPVGGNFTMDIQEAVIASEFIECDNIMGVHFDSFEMIEINHDDAKQTFKNKNKTLNLLSIGEHLTV